MGSHKSKPIDERALWQPSNSMDEVAVTRTYAYTNAHDSPRCEKAMAAVLERRQLVEIVRILSPQRPFHDDFSLSTRLALRLPAGSTAGQVKNVLQIRGPLFMLESGVQPKELKDSDEIQCAQVGFQGKCACHSPIGFDFTERCADSESMDLVCACEHLRSLYSWPAPRRNTEYNSYTETRRFISWPSPQNESKLDVILPHDQVMSLLRSSYDALASQLPSSVCLLLFPRHDSERWEQSAVNAVCDFLLEPNRRLPNVIRLSLFHFHVTPKTTELLLQNEVQWFVDISAYFWPSRELLLSLAPAALKKVIFLPEEDLHDEGWRHLARGGDDCRPDDLEDEIFRTHRAFYSSGAWRAMRRAMNSQS